ncbi:MAG TPA: carbonic anhydrase, partial [Thermoanaerobaculia bacterium]|nr:carbonic anhydrase [Thermoanaerobaculia bacterium]
MSDASKSEPAAEGVELLLEQNRAWAARRKAADPAFFERLCEVQHPKYLWIGCSDSRVPANEIVDLLPGEMFVHRNISNLVTTGDPNVLAVVEYAVVDLAVRDIIVCGHYGCGGVRAVLDGKLSQEPAHVERWLAPLAQLALTRSADLAGLSAETERWRKLCEWNVHEQVGRLLASNVLIAAGLRGEQVR